MSDAEIFELKQRVAALERRLDQLDGGRQVPAPSGGMDPRVQQLVNEGKKINAIKLYRELTGVGLAEAKNAVDAMESQLGL